MSVIITASVEFRKSIENENTKDIDFILERNGDYLTKLESNLEQHGLRAPMSKLISSLSIIVEAPIEEVEKSFCKINDVNNWCIINDNEEAIQAC